MITIMYVPIHKTQEGIILKVKKKGGGGGGDNIGIIKPLFSRAHTMTGRDVNNTSC